MDQPQKLERRKVRIAARALADQRRWRRVPLPAPGRLLLETGREVGCELIDVSAGGLSARADIAPRRGSKVVLQVEGLGRLEAEVVRANKTNFAGFLRATRRKRDRLGDAITWMHNKLLMGLSEDRSAARKSGHGVVTVRFVDGVTVPASVIDVAPTGVSVEVRDRVRVGETVWINDAEADVTRVHANGFAVVFATEEGAASVVARYLETPEPDMTESHSENAPVPSDGAAPSDETVNTDHDRA